jgi:small redox-active disulfide protein 2
MKIEILGPGCPKCRKLYESALEAKKDLPPGIEIEKVEDINRIMHLDMWSTPGLAVDGHVVSRGQVLSAKEIVRVLQNHLTKEGA